MIVFRPDSQEDWGPTPQQLYDQTQRELALQRQLESQDRRGHMIEITDGGRGRAQHSADELARGIEGFIEQVYPYLEEPELSAALRQLADEYTERDFTVPWPPKPTQGPMTHPAPIIYTACFGDHDQPEDTDQFVGLAELHCFTDNPNLIPKLPHWNVHGRRRRFASARMDAKWYKMSAIHLMPDKPWSIYIDASVRVKDGKAMIAAVRAAMNSSIVKAMDGSVTPATDASGLAFFSHPEDPSRSLEEEAAFSMTMGKYAGEPCVEQVAHYRACGLHPTALVAGGVIGRDHTEENARFEKAWFDECVNWSVQDQLSLPFVLWREGRTPGVIPGNIYDCGFLGRVWSGPDR